MHELTSSDYCICGKAKKFALCCGQYLTGKQYAKTPEQLMRSRYCAYALGGYGEYLINTWHPMMSKQLAAEDLSIRQYQWIKLEVLNKKQSGDQGTVEFKAYYQDQQGVEHVLHENSFFQRIAGKWLYVGANLENKI